MQNSFKAIGFGGASLSSMRTEFAALQLLNRAFDLGITHFDTAPLYGKGYSELIFGKFLKKKRQHVTITSKFGLGGAGFTPLPACIALPLNFYKKKIRETKIDSALHFDADSVISSAIRYSINKSELERAIFNSLKRLQTDYLDYYMIHEGCPAFLTDEANEYLTGLLHRGIVRNLGIASNIHVIRSLDTTSLTNWSVLQYEYHERYSEEVIKKFSDKQHFHHSCLKQLDQKQKKEQSHKQAGKLLAKAVKENPFGKILFSTRSRNRLEANLQSYQQHSNFL